ncbi:MAG: c-type cytochrome [Ardenticatenaceae bacterium]|nr:c-type cytochrome [Ardenticatenaceae bacterium]
MQVKIVIGTISFMLTMIILGFAALREPARLEAFAAAEHGRAVENGAHLFYGNCATCHGIEGKAQQCFDAGSGEPINCVGLPLNSAQLICGDRPPKLDTVGWDGTKQTFIEATIASGRVGTQMPTWSEEFGGPMRDDQIQDVAAFILNWEGDWYDDAGNCIYFTFEWPETVEEYLALEDIVEGDAANGEALYGSYTCVVCHGSLADSASATIGPWLGDIAERGDGIVEGASAEQYVYRSILVPDEHIAVDCPLGPCAGPPSAMRQTFASDMGSSPQDMADLLAYLLGQ